MKRIVLKLSLLFGLGISVGACATPIDVSYAYDRAAPFREYKTFAMLEPNRPVPTASSDLDPFVMQRLRQLTYERLKAMGLRPVPKESAALVVNVTSAEDSRTEVYGYASPGYSRGPYGPGWSTFGSGYTVTSRTYQEVKLVIDLVDRAKSAAVWRGVGARSWGSVPPDEELNEFVTKILLGYPPATAAR